MEQIVVGLLTVGIGRGLMIRVVDIFAGPGGLSEGFSSVTDKCDNSVFDIMLSLEMDAFAHETLKLRTFFRSFSPDIPNDYYRHLRQEIGRDALYEAYPTAAREAAAKCWHAKLGPGGEPTQVVRERISEVLGGVEDWVLIGGPPCQAYSLAGRSRNRGNAGYNPKKDVRQKLYLEYLQILADHRPAVFLMENVKGLLSATLDDERMFHRILEDLRNPVTALEREGRHSLGSRNLGYGIFSLVERRLFSDGDVQGSIICSEDFGVPQARHRVILIGIRNDIERVSPNILKPQPVVPMSAAISSLPRLRSGLSRIKDSARAWERCLRTQVDSRWANAGASKADTPKLSAFLREALAGICAPINDRGGEFVFCEAKPGYNADWYHDSRIKGVCNHSTRGHMEKDLYRYIYAACYAKLYGKSPTLKHFPVDLLPDHASVELALSHGRNFSDRFRAQVADNPSTTIVSHISKDGHYYIHPDPGQCRSFTVREAARLQTFPDNYYFCGSRTAQYVQVGNAVPPLLARQIGEIVRDVLLQGDGND